MSKSGQFDIWGEWKEYASFEAEPEKYEEATPWAADIEFLPMPEDLLPAPEPPVQPQQDDSACIDCVRPLDRGPGGCRCWEKD